MPAQHMRNGIYRKHLGGKDPKPPPFLSVVRIFSLNRIRQIHSVELLFSVKIIEIPCLSHLADEVVFDGRREHSPSVLVAFAPCRDDVTIEVDVLDPEMQAFLKPQAAAVDEYRHEPVCPGQMLKERLDFRSAEHHRQAALGKRPDGADFLRTGFFFDDMTVEEYEGVQSLILRGRGDTPFYRERAEEVLHVHSRKLDRSFPGDMVAEGPQP